MSREAMQMALDMLNEIADHVYCDQKLEGVITALRQALETETEALRLADALDAEFVQGRISNSTGRESAVELRRLHEVNQELLASVVELLNCIQPDRDWHEAKRARATIAKATGEKA